MSDPRSGPGLPDDLAPDHGHIETTTWGEVSLGHIVQDKKDRLHLVTDAQQGWLLLTAVRDGRVTSFCPAAILDQPVNIYVPSATEAKTLLDKELGARLLRDVEEREHTLAKMLTWKVEPLGRSAVALRDHIDMIHGGVYVDDLLGRFTRARVAAKDDDAAGNTESAKKNRKKAAVNLDTLRSAHATMHEDPASYPMAFPHHHEI